MSPDPLILFAPAAAADVGTWLFLLVQSVAGGPEPRDRLFVGVAKLVH